MTDAELRDAAVAKLKLTTTGYRKSNGQPKPPPWPEGSTHWKPALDLLAQIGATPPSSSVPGSKVTLAPGQVAAWMVCDSPNRQSYSGPVDRAGHALIVWDDTGQRVTGEMYAPPLRCYILHGFKLITGYPGRFLDLHTTHIDVPWGWAPKMYPGGPQTYVAPFAVDYAGQAGVLVSIQADDWSPYDPGPGRWQYPVMTHAEAEARRGQWTWLLHEVAWGAKWMPTEGSVKTWLVGESVPRLNLTNVNTQWYEQHMVSMWEGAYSHAGSSGCVVEIAAARLGRTQEQCYADTPTVFTREGAGEPPGTITPIPDVSGP